MRLKCCSWHLWVFNTSADLKIKIIFEEFNFERSEFLVMGDGPISGSTTFANFSQKDHPDNATSRSNATWMLLQYDLNKCCRHPSLHLTIMAIEDTGTILLL